MNYVDGFLIPVPAANRQAYLDMATTLAPHFHRFGATRVVECWQDDVPPGETTDFFRAVKASEEERIVFAWVEWPSRAVRDAGMARMRADPVMDPADATLSFDGRRMIFGGFSVMLDH